MKKGIQKSRKHISIFTLTIALMTLTGCETITPVEYLGYSQYFAKYTKGSNLSNEYPKPPILKSFKEYDLHIFKFDSEKWIKLAKNDILKIKSYSKNAITRANVVIREYNYANDLDEFDPMNTYTPSDTKSHSTIISFYPEFEMLRWFNKGKSKSNIYDSLDAISYNHDVKDLEKTVQEYVQDSKNYRANCYNDCMLIKNYLDALSEYITKINAKINSPHTKNLSIGEIPSINKFDF